MTVSFPGSNLIEINSLCNVMPIYFESMQCCFNGGSVKIWDATEESKHEYPEISAYFPPRGSVLRNGQRQVLLFYQSLHFVIDNVVFIVLLTSLKHDKRLQCCYLSEHIITVACALAQHYIVDE